MPSFKGLLCTHRIALPLLFLFPVSVASAQMGGFASPGSPGTSDFGQSTRFDNEFNPAVSLVVDLLADYRAYSGDTPNGVDLKLRRVDLLIADWVDPSAYLWAPMKPVS